MADLNVILPMSCSESWDDMSDVGCNRHCEQCDKIIYDLSKLSVDETEALLDSDDEVCVRARVRKDGSVVSAHERTGAKRRIVALVGASLSLATAACQTSDLGKVSPRYEITGQLKTGSWASTATLVSSSGKSHSTRIWGTDKFRFGNLKPGTYSLTLTGTCEAVYRLENIVISDDVNLSDIVTDAENDCIIIGVMQSAKTLRRA